MIRGRGRILVYKNEYLCWDPSEPRSSPSATTIYCATLQSVVQNLSVRSVDNMNDEQRERKKPVCVNITKLAPAGDAVEPERSHAKIQITNNSTLSIWKKWQGVYLIALETWDDIKYLQVSNVDGYVVAFDGILLVPSLKQVQVEDRTMLMSLVHNSLWTNGKDILKNDGAFSMTRHDDVSADVPSIKLVDAGRLLDDVTPISSWRLYIERVLLTTMADKMEYEEQGLRSKRRQYLLRKSLEVLHEIADSNDSGLH
jgi:hypothetical protein